MLPVKRIPLLIEGLVELGNSRKETSFEWIHIGSGPLDRKIRILASQKLPENVKYAFKGLLPNECVISFYKKNAVDIFINVSKYEGIPVAVMEAQSCGIPVIATSVGGVPEIVSNDVGLLIRADPTPREICSAICSILDQKNSGAIKRLNSKQFWNEYYNSEKNFRDFAQKVKKNFEDITATASNA